MQLPFTAADFLSVFERYNRAIGPAPLVAYALGFTALVLAWRGGRMASRIALAVLAVFWAFQGAVYHLGFFRAVNPAATAFGILFLAQAAGLGIAAVRADPPRFRGGATPRHALAAAFALYALIAYPVLGAALGHAYPRSPVFGVAPCPTTIFTFAILLLAEGPVPVWLFAIPFSWSLVGVSAAVQLGIREDYGLALAGLAGTAVLLLRRRTTATGTRSRVATSDAQVDGQGRTP